MKKTALPILFLFILAITACVFPNKDNSINLSSYYNKNEISSAVFKKIKKSIDDSVEKYKAQGGAVVVMDADTSTILSTYVNSKTNTPLLELSYEAGSVMTPFNIALGLDSGKIKPTDTFDATKPLKVGKHKITDYRVSEKWLTAKETLIHSSNIASALIALKIGGPLQYDFMEKLGLLSEIEDENVKTNPSLFPKKENWINNDERIATISYGFGISYSPIHLITAYSAIINGGVYHKPNLKSNNDDGVIRIISEETSNMMRGYLRDVVKYGNARNTNMKNIEVMAKTGTTNKLIDRKYAKGRNITTVVSNFDYDGKKYAVLVLLDEPQGIKETYNFNTSGWNAVPTLKKVIEAITHQ